MTFDDELTLIKLTHGDNEIGDAISAEERTIVLCEVMSVTRSEHYAAAQNGLRPEITFIVNVYDYDDQQRVEYEGKLYKVIRHFQPKKSKALSDFETIELVCQGLESNG